MPFRPIERVEQLPAIGTRREDLNLDFKATVATTKQAELAKDVAAFANASGGTILIGANEHKPTNTLRDWVPMSATDARAAVDSVSEAVLARCSPPPVIDPQVLERSPGQFVVAVNVWPSALLPVVVRVPTDKNETDKKWDAWVVFVRVGSETKLFTPEQAAMLMIPTIRHTVTLLDSIPVKHRQGILVAFRMPQMGEGKSTKSTYVDLIEVRPLENVAAFVTSAAKRPDSHNSVPPGEKVNIPLSEIVTLWALAEEGGWCIKVDGQFAGVPLRYVPN